MAGQSFSQKISLEGVEEVKEQLSKLGQSGEKAFKGFSDATNKSGKDLEGLSKGVNNAQGAMQRFGQTLPGVAGALAPFSAGLSSMLGLFGTLAGGAGVLAAVGALGFFVKGAADAVVAADRASKALGLTADQFSLLKKAARDAGIDQDQLTGALTRFSGKAAAEAKEQFSELAKIVEVVGKAIQGQSFSNPSILRFATDIEKLKTAIAPVAAQVKAELDKIATPASPPVSLQRIEEALKRIATQGDEAGLALRKSLLGVGAEVPALTPLENLDKLLQKNKVSLASLGVSLLDAQGNEISLFDALEKTLGALNKMPDGLKKTAVEAQIFGRAIGPELGEAFKGLDFAAFKAALERAGTTLDDSKLKAIEAGFAFKKMLNELEDASKKTSGTLLTVFGPLLTEGLKAFQTAITQDAEDVKRLGALFGPIFDQVTTNVKNFASIAGGLFSGLSSEVSGKLKAAFDGLSSSDIAQSIKSAVQGVPAAFTDIWNTVKADASQAIGEIATFFAGLPSRIGTAFDELKGVASRTVDDVVNFFATLPSRIGQAVQGVAAALSQVWDDIKNAASRAVDQIVNFFSNIKSRISGVLSGIGDFFSGGGGGSSGGSSEEGFATGGFVRGPGTSTSDSIPAWLSDGEYVEPSHVVRQPGVFAFLEMLRISGGDLADTINRLRHSFTLPQSFDVPKFSLGGFVDGIARSFEAPRFAGGGLVAAVAQGGGGSKTSRTPVTFVLDGQSIGGFSASDDALAQLKKASIRRQYSSAGRRQSAVR